MPAKDRSEEYLDSMLPIMGTNSYGNQGAERARIRGQACEAPLRLRCLAQSRITPSAKLGYDTRCRPFYRDKDARLSILANGSPEGRIRCAEVQA